MTINSHRRDENKSNWQRTHSWDFWFSYWVKSQKGMSSFSFHGPTVVMTASRLCEDSAHVCRPQCSENDWPLGFPARSGDLPCRALPGTEWGGLVWNHSKSEKKCWSIILALFFSLMLKLRYLSLCGRLSHWKSVDSLSSNEMLLCRRRQEIIVMMNSDVTSLLCHEWNHMFTDGVVPTCRRLYRSLGRNRWWQRPIQARRKLLSSVSDAWPWARPDEWIHSLMINSEATLARSFVTVPVFIPLGWKCNPSHCSHV